MVTIKVSQITLDKIRNDYSDFIIEKDIGYILFVAKKDDSIITAYDNKKGTTFKITIQSNDPLTIANKYAEPDKIIENKKKITKESAFFIDVDKQIGSDEVGTGDFLGPIVVCAAFVDHSTMTLINKYGICDSKKLTDEKIMGFVPLILNRVYTSVQILDNERYNDAYKKGFNINKIKAILHNYCLYHLHLKFPYVKNVYVDQFVNEDKYFEYLKNIKDVEKHIVFKEKGESYFPSVALASCIARYYFIDYMNKLSNKYGMKIPYGASNSVNEFSKKFIEKYGLDELIKISKNNFSNLDEIQK